MTTATYATRDDLRQYLQQVEQTPESDAVLQACLDRAQSIVDGALTFTFAGYSTASAKSVRSYGASVLALPPHQAGSVTSVVYGGAALDTDGYEETPGGYLAIIEPVTGFFTWRGWAAPAEWPRGVYLITAAWGYGTPPDSIVQVTLELAVNIYRAKDKGMFTDTIGVDGSGGVQYIGGMTNLQKQIVENVRRQYQAVVI